LGVAVKDRLTASQVAAPSVSAGSDRGGSLRASLFDGGCIGDSQQSYLSKKREKMSVKGKGRRRRDVGSEESTSLIRISKNGKTSGVDGLQVDLEEESNKGYYHIGGKFRSQKGISIT
jgi:hypothetical protein